MRSNTMAAALTIFSSTVENSPEDEPGLMTQLRRLVDNAPGRSIELARKGQKRFPNSPDVPERSWVIAKALVSLGRFEEACDEARRLVRKYPDNVWALDAVRHLLLHPLDLVSRQAHQHWEWD